MIQTAARARKRKPSSPRFGSAPTALLLGFALTGCWWPSPGSFTTPSPTPSPAPADETPAGTGEPGSSPTPPLSPTPMPTPMSTPASTPPASEICLDFVDQDGNGIDGCTPGDASARYDTRPGDGLVGVASLGDLNGDGEEDLALVPNLVASDGVEDGGAALIFYGSPSGFDLEHPDATLAAAADGDTVSTVAAVGDVNGDGYTDLLVGAPRANPSGLSDAGAVYLVCGGPEKIVGDLELGGQGTNLTIVGSGAQLGVGQALSPAGHFNRDGLDDFLVTAATYQNGDGHAFVFYGSPTLCDQPGTVRDVFDADIDLHLVKGSGENLGWSAAPLGDVDGDGLSDVALGAPGDKAGLPGSVYLVFGADYPAPTQILVSDSSPATLVIQGEQSGDRFGAALAGGVDLNGDGQGDLLVGAPGYSLSGGSDTGAVYVVAGLGRPSGSNHVVVDAPRIPGPGPESGFGVSVAAFPDVNGDGFNDFLVGADTAGDHGSAILFGGSDDGPSMALTALDGQPGGQGFGTFVAAANVDGQGPPELIVSTARAPETSAAAVYLFRVAQ